MRFVYLPKAGKGGEEGDWVVFHLQKGWSYGGEIRGAAICPWILLADAWVLGMRQPGKPI